MKKFIMLFLLVLFNISYGLPVKIKDKNGFIYEYYKGNNYETRVYYLKNGLKIYLSQNSAKPTIDSAIVFNVGSKNDPLDTTGLAHYLEHMMFKGTDKIGTIDWRKEKKILTQLENLYEKYRSENNENRKKDIYKKIDSLAQKAARYAIPNEYSMLTHNIGSTFVNAYTSYDATVYQNKFPSNQFKKWNKLERERFNKIVLRLFPTELEAVYEEYNGSLDDENRLVEKKILKSLFKNHPYGEKTVLGKMEHLKNPSMKKIKEFYDRYYVANNMAIILVGDFEYEKVIKELNNKWSDFRSNNKVNNKIKDLTTIDKPIINKVKTPSGERVHLAYRVDGANSKDVPYYKLIDLLLNNSATGLIDTNLVNSQKLVAAGSNLKYLKDYGVFELIGAPHKGMSLERVKDLLLEQINLLKSGNFDEWLIYSTVNNYELSTTLEAKGNKRLTSYIDQFIYGLNIDNEDKTLDKLKQITKKDLVQFVNKKFKNNYTVLYKLYGKNNKKIIKKPKITPIKIIRDKNSKFYKEFINIKTKNIEPEFLDYKDLVKKIELKNKHYLHYLENKDNKYFSLSIVYNYGTQNNEKLPLAISLLKYGHTDRYDSNDIAKKFYELGIAYKIDISKDETVIQLSGISDNMEKSVSLLEKLLTKFQIDDESFNWYMNSIINSYKIDRDNPDIIFDKMIKFAKYDKSINSLNVEKLKNIKKIELISSIKNIVKNKRDFYYYGPLKKDQISIYLNNTKLNNEKALKVKIVNKIVQKKHKKDIIYFTHVDNVQSKIMILSEGKDFNKNLINFTRFFNGIYGGESSSIMFQELRESAALAYTVFAKYDLALYKDEKNYLNAFISTQGDKTIDALKKILDTLNRDLDLERSFINNKISLIKTSNSERVRDEEILWRYRYLNKMNFNSDFYQKNYKNLKSYSLKKFKDDYKNIIKNKKRIIIIMGNKNLIDFNKLNKVATVKIIDKNILF